jgi:diacylglycerol kinase (ATP)
VIDCGELDGRLFVNVAGIGLDAQVAHEFAAHGLVRRGFLRYLEIAGRQMLRFEAANHTITADQQTVHSRALIVAIANARQYGNGAIIAPQAQIDDGKLDVVVVDDRPVWQILINVPRLFNGRIGEVAGVSMLAGSEIDIASDRAVLYHVDGEPFAGTARLRARALPKALRVKVPAV